MIWLIKLIYHTQYIIHHTSYIHTSYIVHRTSYIVHHHHHHHHHHHNHNHNWYIYIYYVIMCVFICNPPITVSWRSSLPIFDHTQFRSSLGVGQAGASHDCFGCDAGSRVRCKHGMFRALGVRSGGGFRPLGRVRWLCRGWRAVVGWLEGWLDGP